MKIIIVNQKIYIDIHCRFKNYHIFAAEKYLIPDEKDKSYKVMRIAKAFSEYLGKVRYCALRRPMVAWQEQVHPNLVPAMEALAVCGDAKQHTWRRPSEPPLRRKAMHHAAREAQNGQNNKK